jgi:hypothetical protein
MLGCFDSRERCGRCVYYFLHVELDQCWILSAGLHNILLLEYPRHCSSNSIFAMWIVLLMCKFERQFKRFCKLPSLACHVHCGRSSSLSMKIWLSGDLELGDVDETVVVGLIETCL